jgi:hypothetical protein
MNGDPAGDSSVAQGLSENSSFQKGSSPQEILPPAGDIAEHAKLRRREMASISERLGRLPRMPWSRVWGGLAAILFGAAIGGAVSALQLSPHTDKGIYWGIVGGTFLFGLIAVMAALATNDERSDSVSAIKADLDRLLAEGDRKQG